MRTRSGSIFGSPTKNLLDRPSGPGGGASRGRSPAPKNERQNIHRYAEEFEQISELGSGEFGTVMKCKFRIGERAQPPPQRVRWPFCVQPSPHPWLTSRYRIS